MKHVIGKLAVIGSLLAFCGCAAEAKTAAAEKEGVTVEISNITYSKMNARDTKVRFTMNISNQSGEDISAVHCTLKFSDRSGNELASARSFYLEDAAIAAGTSVTAEKAVIMQVGEMPSACAVEIDQIDTLAEHPLDPVPQPLQYLYEIFDDEHLRNIKDRPPVHIQARIDRMDNYRLADFTEGDGLDEALDAFMKMQLGSDNAPMVTDNYNYILLEWEDGAKVIYNFNLEALEIKTNGKYHSYFVGDEGGFWQLVHSRISWD